MPQVRLASVPFVNADPLTWGFRRSAFGSAFAISNHVPSRIADLMRAAEVDVGLIPVVEYQRVPGLQILPHLCVASRRHARSVLLASRVPMTAIRSIALDVNSRTSVALLKTILEYRGIRDVCYSVQEPSIPAMLRQNDAALIIGDPALACDTSGLTVWDLGEEWAKITGLPFVFAVWALREGADMPTGLHPFLESRREGLAHIETIAQEAAPRLGLPPASVECYLRSNIHYELGPEELRGLDLFLRQAFELRLVPGRQPIRFLEPEAPRRPPPSSSARGS